MPTKSPQIIEETRLMRVLLKRLFAASTRAASPKITAAVIEALCASGGPLEALSAGLKTEQDWLDDIVNSDALDAYTHIGNAAAAIETAIEELTSARQSLGVL